MMRKRDKGHLYSQNQYHTVACSRPVNSMEKERYVREMGQYSSEISSSVNITAKAQ